MEQSDRTRFATALKMLLEAFPRVITPDTIDVYWEALTDKPIETVERACKYLTRNHPKNVFPTPFEIRTACTDSFVPIPEHRRIEESQITPKQRRWNKMILNLTLQTMAESTPTNPKYVRPENIEAHARSVGFDPEFIEVQMKHYFKALEDLGCTSTGEPRK